MELGLPAATKPVLLWLSPDTARPLLLQGDAAICFPFCPCRTSNAGHWPCTQSPNSKIPGQQPRQPHVAMGSLLAHQQGSETDNLSCILWRKGSFPVPPFLPSTGGQREASWLGPGLQAEKGAAGALNLRKHFLWRLQESSRLHLSQGYRTALPTPDLVC